MHDLIIKGGTLVDGTGAAPRQADVAVDAGRITEVGQVAGGATRIIDADGLLVTPGWVDIHTHYDGQATWDSELAPSSWHGVTTLVMGNCGVGFAPARPDRHDWLIGLMEGVEDIPGTALAEGIEWEWETFPEYLDALERRRWTVDVGTQVPHGGRAGLRHGRAGRQERGGAPPRTSRPCGAIVLEALRAGALGFSTSRTLGHRAIDGEVVPGTYAAEDELFGIGAALGEAGAGVFELAPLGSAGEHARRRLAGGRLDAPALGRHRPSRLLRAARRWTTTPSCGASSWPRRSRPAPRAPSSTRRSRGGPTGLCLGAPRHVLPLLGHPGLPGAAGARLLAGRARRGAGRPRGPARRSCRGRRRRRPRPRRWRRRTSAPSCSGDPPDYEPGPERSLAGVGGGARRVTAGGRLRRDGPRRRAAGCSTCPILNYATGDLDHVHDMLLHPQGLLGLSDGGAHTGTICDASMPTFMLTHWTRDRSRGATLPLEYVVKKQTHDTARLYGMSDRGTVEPGALADFNLIDYDGLSLGAPFVRADLPAGRPPPAPAGHGVRGHHQEGDGHVRARVSRPGSSRAAWSRGGVAERRRPALVSQWRSRRRAPRHGRLHLVWRRRRPSTRCATACTSATRCGAPSPGADIGRRPRVQQRAHDLHRRDGRRAELAPLHRAGRPGSARLIRFDAGGLGLSDPLPTGIDSLHRGLGPRRARRHGRTPAAIGRRAGVHRRRHAGAVAGGAPTPNGCASLVIVNGTARVGRAEDYGFGVSDAELAAGTRHRRADDSEDGVPRDIAIFAPSLAHRVGFREWWGRAARRGASPATAHRLQHGDVLRRPALVSARP